MFCQCRCKRLRSQMTLWLAHDDRGVTIMKEACPCIQADPCCSGTSVAEPGKPSQRGEHLPSPMKPTTSSLCMPLLAIVGVAAASTCRLPKQEEHGDDCVKGSNTPSKGAQAETSTGRLCSITSDPRVPHKASKQPCLTLTDVLSERFSS